MYNECLRINSGILPYKIRLMPRYFSLIIVFLIISAAFTLNAQNGCNMTVDAGDDVTICDGENTTLNASVTGGNNPTYAWTPAAGLSDPNILNPIASPLVTTTYILTASAESDNLIVNGGFETGDINPATSGYTQVSDPVAIATSAPNFYGVLSVPQIVQAFGCTPDIGQYTMVIHGSTGVNVNFWCQTIPVTPNTDYKLSFKVFGIPYFFAPAPNIVLKMNGAQIGSLTAPNGLCAEASANFNWNSGANTSVDVCLANSTVAGLGSMCSVDDITMIECCSVVDSVTVSVNPNVEEDYNFLICEGDVVEVGGMFFSDPGNYTVDLQNYLGCDSIVNFEINHVEVEALISVGNQINCLLDQALLDGSLSSGTFGIQTYSWSTANGVIIGPTNGSSAVAGAPGSYTLLVTTTNGMVTCSDAVTVVVGIDTLSPVFVLDPPPVADCQDSIFILSAVGNNLPPNAQIIWTTTGGQILSGGNTLMPTVQGTGTYILTITNPLNGCSTTDSLTIQAGGGLPVIQAISIPTITCRDSQVLIVMQVVQPDSGFTMTWSTPDGWIIQGGDSLTPLVGQSGTYELMVVDTLSNCANSFTVQVTAQTAIPIIDIAATDTMDCLTDSLFLSGVIPPGFNHAIPSWSTMNGVMLSQSDSLGIWVGSPGMYLLAVIDTLTGCEDTATVTILSDAQIPAVAAGPDLTIDCDNSTVSPNTSGTAQGLEIHYLWTTIGGNISNDTILNPVFSAPGMYILTVFNSANGCRSSDTVMVIVNGDLPVIVIGNPDTLTCITSQVMIPGLVTGSSNIVMNWSGPGGGIVSGQGTSMPLVQQPGWYIITATDTLSQCVSMDSVRIIQNIIPPLINIAVPDQLDCDTPFVTLDAGASTGGALLFEWTTPSGNILSGSLTAFPIVNAGGVYTLLLTDQVSGCTATQQVTVVQDPNLPVISIGTADTLTCLMITVTLTSSAQNAPAGSTYLWTTNGGNIITDPNDAFITVGAPGIYTVVLTVPGGGCTATDVVVVIEDTFVPDVTVSGSAEINCTQPSVIWSAAPVNFSGALQYEWVSGTQTQTGATLTLSTGGTWQLTWTVLSNGCSNQQVLTVTENTTPPIANAGPDQNIPCGGGQVTLNGSTSSGQGLLMYQWTTQNGQLTSGQNAAIAEAGGAGTYQLLVTDSGNGCTAVDHVVVTSSGTGTPFTLAVNVPECPGQEGSLTVLWSNQDILQLSVNGQPVSVSPGVPIPWTPGVYQVRITDSGGCQFDTTIVIPQGSPLQLSAPTEITITKGGNSQVTLSANVPASSIGSILWNPVTGVTPTSNPWEWILSPQNDQSYTVTLTTVSGCSATTNIFVRVISTRRIFIPNVFSPSDVNGINDRFFPYSSEAADWASFMRIYDRWGNQIFEQMDFPMSDADYGWDGTYNGKQMDPGVYVWVIGVVDAQGGVRVYKGDVTLF